MDGLEGRGRPAEVDKEDTARRLMSQGLEAAPSIEYEYGSLLWWQMRAIQWMNLGSGYKPTFAVICSVCEMPANTVDTPGHAACDDYMPLDPTEVYEAHGLSEILSV